jgi:hypothetical protein
MKSLHEGEKMKGYFGVTVYMKKEVYIFITNLFKFILTLLRKFIYLSTYTIQCI